MSRKSCLNPNARSRLVARDIRTAGQDSIFAPTSPLESLRMIFTMATISFGEEWNPVRDPHSEEMAPVFPIDISRAYFNARTSADDPIYVQFPPEA